MVGLRVGCVSCKTLIRKRQADATVCAFTPTPGQPPPTNHRPPAADRPPASHQSPAPPTPPTHTMQKAPHQVYASSYRMRRRKPNSAAAGTTEDQNYSHFEGSSEVSVSMKIHGTLGAPSVKVGGRAGCPSPSRRSLSLFRSPRRSLSLPLSPFSSLSFSLPLLLALSPNFSGCAPQSLSHVAGPARLWQRVERMGCELELPTCPRVVVVQGLVTWRRRRARAQGVVGGGLVIVW